MHMQSSVGDINFTIVCTSCQWPLQRCVSFRIMIWGFSYILGTQLIAEVAGKLFIHGAV